MHQFRMIFTFILSNISLKQTKCAHLKEQKKKNFAQREKNTSIWKRAQKKINARVLKPSGRKTRIVQISNH